VQAYNAGQTTQVPMCTAVSTGRRRITSSSADATRIVSAVVVLAIEQGQRSPGRMKITLLEKK